MGNCCAAPRAAGQEEGKDASKLAAAAAVMAAAEMRTPRPVTDAEAEQAKEEEAAWAQSPGEWLAAWRAGPGAAAEAALGAPVAPTAAELAAADADTLWHLLTPERAAMFAKHVPPAEVTPRLLGLLDALPAPRLAALCAEVGMGSTLLSLACVAQAPAPVLARLLAARPAAAAEANDQGHWPLHALLKPRKYKPAAAVRGDLAAPALAALARALVAAHPAAAATAVAMPQWNDDEGKLEAPFLYPLDAVLRSGAPAHAGLLAALRAALPDGARRLHAALRAGRWAEVPALATAAACAARADGGRLALAALRAVLGASPPGALAEAWAPLPATTLWAWLGMSMPAGASARWGCSRHHRWQGWRRAEASRLLLAASRLPVAGRLQHRVP